MTESTRAAVLVVAAATLAAISGDARAATTGETRPAGLPGSQLAVDKTHTYTMTGRVRPLLFWISRANVGGGRIVWRRGEAGQAAYELLIGSDPRRTPRAINRWGFIAEETRGSSGSLLGLMSASDERTIAEVEASLGRDGGRFKAIQARVEPGSASAGVATVVTLQPFTFRDVETVIDRAQRELGLAAVSAQAVPAGARTGFLAAMAELIRTSLERHRSTGARALPADGLTIPYVYGRTVHDLSLVSDALVSNVAAGGRTYPRAIRARFDTRSRESGERHRFDLVYGIDGGLAEVPLAIIYRPRWWLQVELTLDDGTTATDQHD